MANIQENRINEIIKKYRNSMGGSANIELEIRLKGVTKEIFEQVYSKMCGPDSGATLQCSIDVISENVLERNDNDRTSYILHIDFKNGVRGEQKYVRKTRLINPLYINDFYKYTIGLAEEKSISPFKSDTGALFRFKTRVSVPLGKWKADFTLVKQSPASEVGPALNIVKGQLFKPHLTPANLLAEFDHSLVDRYEIELEYDNSRAAELTPADIKIVNTVFENISDKYGAESAYQNEIYKIATLIFEGTNQAQKFRHTNRLKYLLNQVESLSKNSYYAHLYPPEGYYVTEKADGVRTLIVMGGHHPTTAILLDSSGHEERPLVVQSGAILPSQNGGITIVDTEMIVDNSTEGAPVKRYYVFDILFMEGKRILDEPFSRRVEMIADCAKMVAEKTGLVITGKNYHKLASDPSKGETLESKFRLAYTPEKVGAPPHPYPVDGLIIVEPNENYLRTKNYKWKPTEHNTIDFLAVKCPQKLLGIRPYEVREGHDLYLLFVGINDEVRNKMGLNLLPHYRDLFDTPGDYYPIQFSPSSNPHAYLFYADKGLQIDRKVVELKLATDTGGKSNWQLVRVREDRKLEKNYYGNDFKVAELTYINYYDPFDFEDLFKPRFGYFVKVADDIHMAPNRYKRFVISDLLSTHFAGANWIIDEAAGRGADLHRYKEIGVRNGLFIEIDPTNMAELIARKFDYFSKRRGMGAKTDIPFSIHTLVADLKTPNVDLIKMLGRFPIVEGTIDGILCDFAFHYMCDTAENVRNLLRFNAKMLKIGGTFIFSTLNGAKVFELLREGNWEAYQDEIRKYSVKRLYGGTKFANTGQMISVFMAFADTYYDEPLCNIDFVIKEAAKMGFVAEINSSFASHMDKFAQADRTLYERLTEDDKKYIDLYQYVVLRLVKRK